MSIDLGQTVNHCHLQTDGRLHCCHGDRHVVTQTTHEDTLATRLSVSIDTQQVVAAAADAADTRWPGRDDVTQWLQR